jgi:drug/metabolite transporter (DMT)-like permease
MDMSNTRKATGLGLVAVLLWAALAALTSLAGRIPPFQLAAMTFAVGTLVGLVWARLKGQSLAVLTEVPLASWCLGVYGLLAFHACYFFALQAAPPLEASLIVFLWPLLLVLLSGLLPVALGGAGLRWWHVAGALLGLAGTMLILMGKGGSLEFSGTVAGYIAAAAAALIWASYSVASRLFARVPSTAVMGSCGLTALGALAFHLLLETTVWPASLTSWLAVIALGLGPVGTAFYLWDEGMKHGDIRLLGVVAYTTPLFSTVILAALGLGAATPAVWLAAALITAGALLASRSGGRSGAAT